MRKLHIDEVLILASETGLSQPKSLSFIDEGKCISHDPDSCTEIRASPCKSFLKIREDGGLLIEDQKPVTKTPKPPLRSSLPPQSASNSKFKEQKHRHWSRAFETGFHALIVMHPFTGVLPAELAAESIIFPE
jgi:hypothetical protein